VADLRATRDANETKLNITQTAQVERGPIALERAQRMAEAIVKWLGPYCEVIEVAGSIRRRRPFVNDVDVVCIPRTTESKDLLGQVVYRKNFCWHFLLDYVREKNPTGSREVLPHFQSGGDREGKSVILQLPKCQADIWFADRENFATRLICRTGSKEHNIRLAERATAKGYHWDPYAGLVRLESNAGLPEEALNEEAFYWRLGLPWIRPEDREGEFLVREFREGTRK